MYASMLSASASETLKRGGNTSWQSSVPISAAYVTSEKGKSRRLKLHPSLPIFPEKRTFPLMVCGSQRAMRN